MAHTPDYCDNCGEEVPSRAKACPACGACEETGWSERARTQAMDIPDDEFDYEEFTAREFGGAKRPARSRRLWIAIVAAILLALFVLSFLR